MGFRYYKRVHLSPWLSFNVSRSGVSTTFGPHGLHFTVGPRGTTESVGLPGTGLSYREQQSASRGSALGWIFKLVLLAIVLAAALLIGTIIGR
jgi:hypothetical protein